MSERKRKLIQIWHDPVREFEAFESTCQEGGEMYGLDNEGDIWKCQYDNKTGLFGWVYWFTPELEKEEA